MQFEISDIDVKADADRKALKDALSRAADDDDRLVTLSKSPEEYIQAFWGDHGYLLRYRTEGADARFTSTKLLSLDEIQEVCLQYAGGDDTWKKNYSFEPEEERDPYEQAGRVAGRLLGRAAVKGRELVRAFKRGYDEGKN